jgi:hypothetical protein
MPATTFTVALYGDSNVGKTTAMRMLTDDEVRRDEPPTLGYDVVESQMSEFSIRWIDTSGSPRWSAHHPWFTGAGLVVLMFDPECRASWLNVQGWMEGVDRWHPEAEQVVLVSFDRSKEGGVTSVSERTVRGTAMVFGMQYIAISNADVTPLRDIVLLYARAATYPRHTLKQRFSYSSELPPTTLSAAAAPRFCDPCASFRGTTGQTPSCVALLRRR